MIEPGIPLRPGKIYDANKAMLMTALKPGKPCIMGRLSEAAFLGLPGNPVAALVTFLMFGQIIISGLLGEGGKGRTFIDVQSAGLHRHSIGKTEFVPARLLQEDGGMPEVDQSALVGQQRMDIRVRGVGNCAGAIGRQQCGRWRLAQHEIDQSVINNVNDCAAPDLQGLPAISAGRFKHTPGKTEFVPARLAPLDSHNLCLEILGRGGSARLSPLLAADGLAEIGSEQDHIELGSPLRFYPFSSLAWI